MDSNGNQKNATYAAVIKSVSSVPIIGTYFFPTLAALGQGVITVGQKLDGVDIVPLLNGENKLNREALYWHYPHYHPEGGAPYTTIR